MQGYPGTETSIQEAGLSVIPFFPSCDIAPLVLVTCYISGPPTLMMSVYGLWGGPHPLQCPISRQ